MTNSTADRKWVIVLMAAIFVVSAQGAALITFGSGQRGPSPSQAYFEVYGYHFEIGDVAGGWLLTEAPCGLSTPCTAPGNYSFDDVISGGNAGGYFSPFDDTSYEFLCYPASSCSVSMDFTGVLTLPDVGLAPPSTIIVTVPFTATGNYHDLTGLYFPFQGYGFATFTLSETNIFGQGSTPGSYYFSSVSYVFTTPEPATMSLVGLALLVLGYRRALR